jgi:hypothetical protein
MSFLTGSGSQASQVTAVSGLQLQSSAYGKVIPIVYGTTRIAPNLIWYGHFVATPQASSGGGAGKGGGGGGKGGSASSYVYQTAVALGLCEGPVAGVGSVYLDKSVTTLSALGLSFFSGAYGQAPWGYLVSQDAPVSEVHVIPSSGPYTVTVNAASDFLSDAGVTQNASGAYAKVNHSPGSLQYTIGLYGSSALYTFSSANGGANVTISSATLDGVTQITHATVPSSAPFTISVTVGAEDNFIDKGVVGTGSVYTYTGGTPATGQYNVAGGIYSFAAGNAGGTVTIVYYTANGTQALGYSGTAYTAASAYQLGTSAQLPNHNFEVRGNAGFTGTAIVSLTGVTLSGCTIQVKNAGVGVARSVNVLAQGY